MKTFVAWFKINYKTNLGALCAFLLSIPQFVTAMQQWQAGQKVDWHGTAICLLIAVIAAVSKDASTHSTPLQVAASGAVVTNQANAPALVKAADKQVTDAK